MAIVWSLELGGDCLEPGGNDKNSGKGLVASCQPQKRCSHVHGSGDSITCLLHYTLFDNSNLSFFNISFVNSINLERLHNS